MPFTEFHLVGGEHLKSRDPFRTEFEMPVRDPRVVKSAVGSTPGLRRKGQGACMKQGHQQLDGN